MVPKRVIIHHSATKDSGTVSWGAIWRYHVEERGWNSIGYHAGIEVVGDGPYRVQTFMGRMWDRNGAHISGLNEGSLGLCVVGNWDEDIVPDDQWRRALEVVRLWLRLFGLSNMDVYGHGEYAELAGGNLTACPGRNFDMNRFRGEL
jgi:N-acetylmuramoyl-L-alanine amidase